MVIRLLSKCLMSTCLMFALGASSYGMEEKKDDLNGRHENKQVPTFLQYVPQEPEEKCSFETIHQGYATTHRPLRYLDCPCFVSFRYTFFPLKNEQEQASAVILLADYSKITPQYFAMNYAPFLDDLANNSKKDLEGVEIDRIIQEKGHLIKAFVQKASNELEIQKGGVFSNDEELLKRVQEFLSTEFPDLDIQSVHVPARQILLDMQSGKIHNFNKVILSDEFNEKLRSINERRGEERWSPVEYRTLKTEQESGDDMKSFLKEIMTSLTRGTSKEIVVNFADGQMLEFSLSQEELKQGEDVKDLESLVVSLTGRDSAEDIKAPEALMNDSEPKKD